MAIKERIRCNPIVYKAETGFKLSEYYCLEAGALS